MFGHRTKSQPGQKFFSYNGNYITDYYFYFFLFIFLGRILLFWVNFPDSIQIFRLQKKIVRIMAGCNVEIHVENRLLT